MECWGHWSTIYKSNKKFLIKLDKVKNVAKKNQTKYYNFLDQANKNYIDQKKNQLTKETSISGKHDNEFMIREIPEGLNSNFNSQRKTENNDDLTSSKQNKLISFSDIDKLKESIEAIGQIMNGFKEFSNFELDDATQYEASVGNKAQFDPILKNFKSNFDKTMKFTGNAPVFMNEDQDKESEYDFKKMQQDVKKLEKIVFQFNLTLNKYIKKEIPFKDFKEEIQQTEIHLFLDFVLEKYKDSENKKINIDEKLQGSMFESDIKETKDDSKTKNNDFKFDMEGEDIFGKPSSPENNKVSTFAVDNEKNAFEDFSANSVKVKIFNN